MSVQNMADALTPRVRDAIRDRFDQIYPRFAPYPSGSAVSIQQHQASYLSEATAVYDSILDYAESMYSMMRFRLSACARINQLPDDVLVHIMSTMPLPELITATHVCHRWRRLGVETPALWTQVTLTSQCADVSHIILARSKAASLDLVINTFPKGVYVPRDYTLLTGPHMDRVRTLTLSDPTRPRWSTDRPWVSPMPPVARRMGMPSPLCAAPRLERLRIDHNSVWGTNVDYSIPFDCSTLQEAYIIRGFANVDFLSRCTRLQVLVLHIPDAVTGPDVLHLVHANPELRTVELHIPQGWEHTADAWDANDVVSADHQIEHLTIRLMVPGCLSGRLDNVTRALICWFDCPRIPVVKVPCHYREAEDAVGCWLLDHLQNVTSIVIGYDDLRLEDASGYVRSFTNMTPWRPLQLALPFLGRVRTCGAHLSQWSSLSDHNVAELPCLEGLSLRCDIEDIDALHCSGVACPALRNFSLVQSWHEPALPRPGLDVASMVAAVSRSVLRNCPPMRSITVVRSRDVESVPLEDQTLHFDPPLPSTVFVISTVSEIPRPPPTPPLPPYFAFGPDMPDTPSHWELPLDAFQSELASQWLFLDESSGY